MIIFFYSVMREPIYYKLQRFESLPVLFSIKNGLISIIPVLLIGSFSLAIQNLPIPGYTDIINSVPFISDILSIVHRCTFGFLSVYATISIAISCADNLSKTAIKSEQNYGAIISTLACFFILIGAGSAVSTGNTDAITRMVSFLGVTGMFSAIICGAACPLIFIRLYERMGINIHSFGDSGDSDFKASIASLAPALITILIFTVLNRIVSAVFGVSCFHDLYTQLLTNSFTNMAGFLNRHGLSFFTGLIFVLVSSVLWFFGIHGSNVLESVMQDVFRHGNLHIVNRTLIEQFVLMGGCGTAICLLISLMIFSKRNSNRKLGRIAAFPMIFNINEIMIFGLPVIYNLYLLIPFILTPLFSYTVAYATIYFGIVPAVSNTVNWTVPVIAGGYIATGSFAGSVLQIVIITAGIFIYRPFIYMYDKAKDREASENINALVEIMKASEKSVVPVKLTDLRSVHGRTANTLVNELHEAIKNHEIKLYYQGQFLKDGSCTGAEALMRWNHPKFGLMYPPLLIKLAEETDVIVELEKQILTMAIEDMEDIYRRTGKVLEIGVNVLPVTLTNPEYMKILEEYAKSRSGVKNVTLCLELTEQTALLLSAKTEELFNKIRSMGYRLAIDDFSMGHTSITYLKDNNFDTVKLDGEIVKGCMSNTRCRDIISSIISLSKNLNFNVIAEYVETEQMRDLLEELGCHEYQGWLYAKAVPKNDFIRMLNSKGMKDNEP